MTQSHSRAAAKGAAQTAIDLASADLARGAISEADWQRRVTDALAAAYLGEDDPRWQSGFDGDAAAWRGARALVLDAIPADGSLLDVGCANGHLMESLDGWARERGLELTLYGLELNPALAVEARRRLAAWADRIYTGNVMDWTPPRRFTYVRTGLEYVPDGRGPALVARLLREVVAPGGRLLVGPIDEGEVPETIMAFAAAGVMTPSVVAAKDRSGKTRCIVWTETTLIALPNGVGCCATDYCNG